MVFIYKIRNVIDGKVYVGSTTNFKNRWKCHRYHLRSQTHHSPHLQHAWTIYGEANFSVEIIDTCSEEDRVEVEQKWLDTFTSYEKTHGYNICRHAESCKGKKHSTDTRYKIGSANRGKVRSELHRKRLSESQIGKTYTDEYRRKMSVSLKGRVLSKESIARGIETRRKNGSLKRTLETRQKMSEKARGKVISEETRAKLSKAGRDRKWTDIQRQKILSRKPYIYTQEDRIKISRSRGGKDFIVTSLCGKTYEFSTLGDAKRQLGLDPSNVHKCLIGQAKQTKGYKCEYKTPELVCEG